MSITASEARKGLFPLIKKVNEDHDAIEIVSRHGNAFLVSGEDYAALRINKLIEDVRRDPFTGIGKPGPLKYHLPGAWSRRIDDEHRLVYIVTEAEIIVLAARYHY